MNFKSIHIGILINKAVTESGTEMSRICNFFKCTEEEIQEMYTQENLSTDVLLKWCKLLEYDFFRIYSHHLILYAPVSAPREKTKGLPRSAHKDRKTTLPQLKKKHLYKRNNRFHLGANFIGRNDENTSDGKIQNSKNDFVQMDK